MNEVALNNRDLIPEEAVAALTSVIFDYSERIAQDLEQPISDLWALALAVTGDMYYSPTELASSKCVRLGVPDAPLRSGLSRFELWEEALNAVLRILGDPEARFRTGYTSAEHALALERFFGLQEETNPGRSS